MINQESKKSVTTLAVLIPLSVMVVDPAVAQTFPIVVSSTAALNFGSFYTQGALGEVLVNTVGTRTTTGAVATIAGAGLESNGAISIAASTGFVVTISMTLTAFNITNGAGDMMVVDDFHIGGNTAGPVITTVLTNNPSVIPFGGTLNVPMSQPAGTYVGTYTVNVIYQ